MDVSLTKSYVDTCDPGKPANTSLVFSEVFKQTREEKRDTLLVNMDTGERLSNLALLSKGEKYARGLLTLGLEPGVDNIAVIGCATFEALAIFAAAAELGYGFAHLFFHPPRAQRIATQLPMIAPKVVITGEGAGGHNFDAILSMFDVNAHMPSSEKLPFVERIFYDSSYKDRSPSHKFIQTLDELIKLGEKVSDEQLLQAKLKVKPEFAIQHLFTSGSTGAPKCATRTQGALTYFAVSTLQHSMSALVMNISVDTVASYIMVIFALAGLTGKVVMMPESYEECPFIDQGRILTQTVIDEELGQLAVTMGALSAIVDYIKANSITLPQPLFVPYGGQLVSKQFILENEQLIKGVHYTGYGMTEVMFIAVTKYGDTPEEVASRRELRMYVAPNTQLRIANEKDEVVDIGVVGEVQVKNPIAVKEYRGDPKRTKALFAEDGFLKTGDMAVMFDDGSIKMKGRITNHERFKIFGKAEYAGPLEEIFNEHADISHTYVVSGKVNDWIGDEITSCIKMKSVEKRIPEEELLNFCREKGMYKRQTPARIIYFNEFPYTDNGRKVSKLKLTAQVQAMVAEDEELGKCKWFAEMEKSGKAY